jgi:predicted NBD/HSP70 family sugar kinase
MRAGPSPEEIRRHNLGSLLRYVHLHGATSRAELTSRLGLNRSTIGALTAELATAGLVTEATPREKGRAGRPSLVVRPQSAKVHAYALSVEADRLRAARVGLGGTILDHREIERPRGTALIEAAGPLAALVADMRGGVADDARYVGTGLAITGLARLTSASPADGDSAAHDSILAAFGPALGERGRLAVGDHAQVAALVEHGRGVAAGCDNLIYLHGDGGVSAGIVSGGRAVAGHGGFGGEVGHMVVNPQGRACVCGSRGCWETEIGERALLERAGRGAESGRDAVLSVVAAAMRGDRQALGAVREVGEWIGFGVGNLANIFNPEMVIFGGTLRDVYLAAADRIRARLNAVALPFFREHLRLRTPRLGADAALIGAAELAFARLLNDPLLG